MPFLTKPQSFGESRIWGVSLVKFNALNLYTTAGTISDNNKNIPQKRKIPTRYRRSVVTKGGPKGSCPLNFEFV